MNKLKFLWSQPNSTFLLILSSEHKLSHLSRWWRYFCWCCWVFLSDKLNTHEQSCTNVFKFHPWTQSALWNKTSQFKIFHMKRSVALLKSILFTRICFSWTILFLWFLISFLGELFGKLWPHLWTFLWFNSQIPD